MADLNPKDLCVETFRGPDQGGWSTRPDLVVRITHRPSGVSVTEGSDPSQHRNRAEALRKLQAIFDLAPELFPTLPKEQYRAELLELAMGCGATMTSKPDGTEAITIVFTIEAWRAFDIATRK